MDERRYLRIYLSERLLAMQGGRDLAIRMRRTATDADVSGVLDEAIIEFDRGASTLSSYLRQIGAGPPRVRAWIVGLAVKAGQLKLNGHLVERSPLSDLQELEALGTVVLGATAAWTALEVAQVASVTGVRERTDALTAIAMRLEPLRSASAVRALGRAR